MSRPRKLTDPDEIAAARVMWLAGVRRKLIADRFGVCRETLRLVVGKLPINPDNRVNGQNRDSSTAQITPYLGSTAA